MFSLDLFVGGHRCWNNVLSTSAFLIFMAFLTLSSAMLRPNDISKLITATSFLENIKYTQIINTLVKGSHEYTHWHETDLYTHKVHCIKHNVSLMNYNIFCFSARWGGWVGSFLGFHIATWSNQTFFGVVCVVTLSFWHFCWCRGFCCRTESDLFLFLLEAGDTQSLKS